MTLHKEHSDLAALLKDLTVTKAKAEGKDDDVQTSDPPESLNKVEMQALCDGLRRLSEKLRIVVHKALVGVVGVGVGVAKEGTKEVVDKEVVAEVAPLQQQ
jgi:hypothetical protein